MTSADVVWDPEWSGILVHNAVRDARSRGVRLVCHRCRAPLQCAMTPEEARDQGIHGGVQCPNNQRHVCILYNFRSDIEGFHFPRDPRWFEELGPLPDSSKKPR